MLRRAINSSGPGRVTLTNAGPQNWDLVPPAARFIFPALSGKARPRNRTSVNQPGPRKCRFSTGPWNEIQDASFSLGRSEERGTVIADRRWNDGNCPPSRPGSGSARCYARTFPDHAERELGAETPTGVARFELATGRLTAVSSAVELHANTCPKAMRVARLPPTTQLI